MKENTGCNIINGSCSALFIVDFQQVFTHRGVAVVYYIVHCKEKKDKCFWIELNWTELN